MIWISELLLSQGAILLSIYILKKLVIVKPYLVRVGRNNIIAFKVELSEQYATSLTKYSSITSIISIMYLVATYLFN